MEKFRVYGASTKDESQRERDHRALARRAAADGMVLLKNDGVLPLQTKTVALYGAGARMTVKGGSGSGEVHERYSVNIAQGLENAGISLAAPGWMDRFDAKYEKDKRSWREGVEAKIKGFSPFKVMQMFDIIHENPMPYPAVQPVLESDLTDETDTAIYVVSRQAGEGGDRKVKKGDYLLSDIEVQSIALLSDHYQKLILIINCGAVLDLSILDTTRIDAVIYYSQGGMEGGNALADILTGKVTPSGRLTDTWAMNYSDYPSADTFSYLNGDLSFNNYYEGIYIGYRWFDAVEKKPRFPFGYGLSYTHFSQQVRSIRADGTVVTVEVNVKNTGDTYSGKEVVQLYLSKPKGILDHERKGLVAFSKTKCLAPGEEQIVTLSFDMAKQGSFDEVNSVFSLESGEYGLLLGCEETCVGVLELDRGVILEKVTHICPMQEQLAEYTSESVGQIYPDSVPRVHVNADAFDTVHHTYTQPVEMPSAKISKLLESLSDDQLASICTGGGYSIKSFVNVPGAAGMTSVELLKKGIPNIVLSDGPAGLNVMQAISVQKDGTPRYPEGLPEDWNWGWLKKFAPFVKAKPGKGRPVYHYMTAFPCETALAQSWDAALLEEVGQAIGREMQEIGVTVWLAPGMNLHRNPLCGRNFEYYSEDPVLTGKMAAAITKGVQSHKGCFVTVKHFCCNNQEDNRDHMSSNLSERTLRELYLRPFRTVIEEANPGTIMTSYNMVNGVYTPNSYDLCTKVLRNEWGFDGVIMSDWNATDKCSHPAAINAGNDLLMPGNKWIKKALLDALKNGELDREKLKASAARVLNLIFSAATSEGL